MGGLLPPFPSVQPLMLSFLCDYTAFSECSFASVAEALHVQLIVKLLLV